VRINIPSNLDRRAPFIKMPNSIFDLRSNNLNLVRLILTLMVIVSHSFVLGGFGNRPEWNETTLGELAVASFFCISGFLLSASAERSTPLKLVWHRIFRIFPAYWLSLIMVALVFSNFVDMTRKNGTGWSFSIALNYIASGVPMILPRIDQIAETLDGNPFPNTWNGSLWTLRYQLILFFVLIPIIFVRKFEIKLIFLITAYLVATHLKSIDIFSTPISGIFHLLNFSIFFLSGCIAYTLRSNIGFKKSHVAIAFLTFCLGMGAGLDLTLLSFPLTYSLLFLIYFESTPYFKLTSKIDISYGMYLFAFPIQQILALMDFQRFGIIIFIIASIVLTLPIAILSLFLIEKPCIRLAKLQLN